MKKQKISPLLIAVGVLAVLGIVYVGILQGKARQEKKQEEEKEYIIKMENVTGLSLQHNGETLEFVKEDGNWVYKEDAEFPLKTSSVSSLESAVSALEPVRVLDGAEEMASYGLTEPQSWVALTGEDGTVKKLLLGDAADDNYYACVEGEGTVYTISSTVLNDLPDDLYDWIQLETFPNVSSTDIVSVQVEKNDGTGYLLEKEENEVLVQKEEETDADTDRTEESSGTEIDADGTEQSSEMEPETELVAEWYVTDNGGTRRKIEASGTADTVTDKLAYLYVTSCANYKASEEELGMYGLLNPTVITYQYPAKDTESTETKDAEIKDTEEKEETLEKMVLEVGSLDESGTYYYVRMQDSQAVNQVSAENLNVILEKTAENFE
ncbi:MAG: DUF4340 domain-containing protein [bacterium]|nr:DUF4340 domain-containing protein [bacterium]